MTNVNLSVWVYYVVFVYCENKYFIVCTLKDKKEI